MGAEQSAPLYTGGIMQGEERTCKKCGHRCHCYQPECEECHNDVCYNCKCREEQKDIPASMLNGL